MHLDLEPRPAPSLKFEEPRVRRGNTNGFVKEDGSDPDNVDNYLSPSCACNGISCSAKFRGKRGK